MDDKAKLGWGKAMSGELLADWPRDSAGEPVEPAFLCTRSCSDLSDQLTMNMLRAYGIPCLSRERGTGGLGRVILGMSGFGVDLYVPILLLDDARKLIEEDDHEEL